MPTPHLLAEASLLERRLVDRMTRARWVSRPDLGRVFGVSGRAVDRWIDGSRTYPRGMLIRTLMSLDAAQHAVAMAWLAEATRTDSDQIALPEGDPRRTSASPRWGCSTRCCAETCAASTSSSPGSSSRRRPTGPTSSVRRPEMTMRWGTERRQRREAGSGPAANPRLSTPISPDDAHQNPSPTCPHVPVRARFLARTPVYPLTPGCPAAALGGTSASPRLHAVQPGAEGGLAPQPLPLLTIHTQGASLPPAPALPIPSHAPSCSRWRGRFAEQSPMLSPILAAPT